MDRFEEMRVFAAVVDAGNRSDTARMALAESVKR